MIKFQFWLMARLLYRELMDLFSNRYGHVPNFRTQVERRLTPSKAELEVLDLAAMGHSFDQLAFISAPHGTKPVDPEDDFEHFAPRKARRSRSKPSAKVRRESAAEPDSAVPT